MKPSQRNLLLFAIVVIVIIFLPPVALRVKSIAVTINLIVPDGVWRPYELFTKKPLREEHRFVSTSGRDLVLQTHIPARRGHTAPAMIIYTPLIGEGINDNRLTNLADTFAQAGFVVAIPWRSTEHLVVGPKDTQDIVSTIQFLKENKELNISDVGLFGISYGNGPVIAAAADDAVKEDISFVVSFAGYYETDNLLGFIDTGTFEYGDIRGTLVPDPYTYEVLGNTLTFYDTTTNTLLNDPAYKKFRDELSPAQYVSGLDIDFYIIHSIGDTTIPYTESLRLADSVDARVPGHFSLNSTFEHGKYKDLTLTNIRKHYLPSFFDFYRIILDLMKNHSM